MNRLYSLQDIDHIKIYGEIISTSGKENDSILITPYVTVNLLNEKWRIICDSCNPTVLHVKAGVRFVGKMTFKKRSERI